VPALITIFYPKIGSILGYVGAVAGLFIVYILPVITHLKKYKTQIEHPLLAKAIENDLFEYRTTGVTATSSPKIVIRRAVMEKTTPRTVRRAEETETNHQVNMTPFYIECLTHSFIIIYGLIILLLTFYNPFN
jgi:hypothetical protein